VEYSLHHGGGVGDIEEVGEATRDGSGSVSPSNLCMFNLCSWFCVSLLPSRENTSGSLYIGDFRSTPSIWDQNGRHQSNNAQTSMGGVAGATPPGLVWASLDHSCASYSHICSRVNGS
jgi:hypothetical protein